MTNSYNTVLYTGVTNNILRRVYEHKSQIGSGFVKRYKLTKLVYYEIFGDITLDCQRKTDQSWIT